MNRCKTCKYWKAEYSGCDCEKFVYIGDEPVSSDGIGCMDAEGYNASMHPGPDFGCVHWKEKDE